MDGKNIVSVFLINGKTDATSKKVVEDIKKRFGKDITTGNFNYMHEDTKHVVLILPDNGFNFSANNFVEQKIINLLNECQTSGKIKIVLAYLRTFDNSIQYYNIAMPLNTKGDITIVGLNNHTKDFLVSVQKDVKQLINSKKEKIMDFDFSALDAMSEETPQKLKKSPKKKSDETKPFVIIDGRKVVGLRLKTKEEFKQQNFWNFSQNVPVNWNDRGMPLEMLGAKVCDEELTQSKLEYFKICLESAQVNTIFTDTSENLFDIDSSNYLIYYRYGSNTYNFDTRHLVPVYEEDTFERTEWGSIIVSSKEDTSKEVSEIATLSGYSIEEEDLIAKMDAISSVESKVEEAIVKSIEKHSKEVSKIDVAETRAIIREEIKQDIAREKSEFFERIEALLKENSSADQNLRLLIG